MQEKQATGLDTRMMVPVYAGVFVILCQCFLPWISMPILKRCRMPRTCTIFHTGEWIAQMQTAAQECSRVEMLPFSQEEFLGWMHISRWLAVASAVMIAVMAFVVGSVLVRKTKSKRVVRLGFVLDLLYSLGLCALGLCMNLSINQRMGRPNTFFNLSIHSEVQVTSWVYGQILVSLLVFLAAGRLLSVQDTAPPEMYVERTMREDHRIGHRTWLTLALILFAIPLVIAFGVYFLADRSNVFIGFCIVCLAMLPFAMVFEGRKPQARELLIIAVMSGIAVVSRMAFFMIPQFKPLAAVVIIAGITLGPEAGFLTGAVSGFVSNFFFGQGPWTPWQMFAFGIIGFLGGLLFYRNKWLKHLSPKKKLGAECLYGGFATLLIYGLIMDLSGILTMTANGITWEALLAKVVSGFGFNLVHASSTVIFLFFLAEPMEKKLNRIKKKYGILEH